MENSYLMDETAPQIKKIKLDKRNNCCKYGAKQINNAITQLNNVTQQNAAASEELTSNSDALSHQAKY